MPKWIQSARVRAAISALYRWRSQVRSQQAMHLWPLLALVKNGVNTSMFVKFTEHDDKVFWDYYGRLAGESRPVGSSQSFTSDYYIEPLVLKLKPADYPHRSPSSIRDRTFLNSWHAAEYNRSTEEWKLVPNYAEIFEEKVLLRGGTSVRIPIVDLAAYLFRYAEFDDNADATALQTKFHDIFKFEPTDYNRLFLFIEESEENIFTNVKPSEKEINQAIRGAMVSLNSAVSPPQSVVMPSMIDDEDRHLLEVQNLLKLKTSGIIFRGCPGTSKTWYADKIAMKLVADPTRDIFKIQFHPSFGYEDFVEGYRPDPDAKSGFRIVNRIFLEAVEHARNIDTLVVFIIDEINRGDPARAFGELLTYIEYEYRNIEFQAALSGRKISVPPNLIMFGTMNPYDRSTVQFDIALVRRFDHIDLKPDVETVELFLTKNEEHPTDFTSKQVSRVVKWFTDLQNLIEPGVGHTYFKNVKSLEDLQTVWDYRMLPYCEAILELDPARLANVQNSFDQMMREIRGQRQVDE